MKLQRLYLLPAAALMVLAIGAPGTVLAAVTERTVVQTLAECPSGSTCYTSIQEAINAADINAGDTVLVEPGTYSGPISLRTNVPVLGRETARTIITGGSATAVNATSVTGVNFRHFTIISASVGIALSDSSSVSIKNNVFQVGTGGTAIQIQIQSGSSTSTEILNNTFYQNGTAVSTNVNLTIKNNIFSNNTHHVTASGGLALDKTYFTYNAFSDNNPEGPDLTSTTNILSIDPLFVDPSTTKRDFHLKEYSPCIDAGDTSLFDTWYSPSNRSDIGAYGGPDSDTIPYPVSILTATGTLSAPYSITLSWSDNKSYLVTHSTTPGGYRIYYSVNKSGAPYTGIGATEGNSPIDAGSVLSKTLNGLSAASAPVPPVLNDPGFADGILRLSWPPVDKATGYIVYYTDLDAVPPQITTEQNKDVLNFTSVNLSGLINYHHYNVEVTAYTQNTYYLAVTAYDSTGQTRDPGKEHESVYSSVYSEEVQIDIGPPAEGARSNLKNEYPEPITAYPNLPNKGCFIATAAYGYYSAPQVQALRELRDRYLMTNTPGRAFVRWYYTYGPVAAQFINEHPGLKPVVRAALLPAVGGAMFMTRSSALAKTILLVLSGLLAFYASLRTVKMPRN
jgi:Periplasmic copper-binding protein (NosD)